MTGRTVEDFCTICREEDTPCNYITGCGHSFHFKCLWPNSYRSEIQQECPYCHHKVSNFTEKERLIFSMKELKMDKDKIESLTFILNIVMNFEKTPAYTYDSRYPTTTTKRKTIPSYGEDLMNDLKKIGWNINSPAEGGLNFLLQACERDDLFRLKLLIDYGLKLDPQSGYEIQATQVATDNKSLLVLEKIEIEKANSIADQFEVVTFENDSGDKLVEACHNNNFDKVIALIEEGVDVNFRDQRGCTALHKACSTANIQIVNYLIENGAEVNCVDLSGKSPLHEACTSKYDRKDVVKKLLEKNANVSYVDQDKNTQLHVAIISRKYEIAEMLIDKYENVELLNIFKESPLHLAADSAPKSLIEKLISRGAVLNAKDNKGRSPLHRAVTLNQVEVVDLMLSKGADVNQTDKNKDSPILLAIKRTPAIPFVSSLVKHSADLNFKNSNGKTALEIYMELYN